MAQYSRTFVLKINKYIKCHSETYYFVNEMSAPVTTDSIAFVLDRQVQVLDFDSAFDFEAILYI